MSNVDLDALIPREDFAVTESNPNPGKKKETLSIEDLKSDSFFFSSVRKPDFQRSTNEWDPRKVTFLIESFVNGDLIPAVILWRSATSYLFVIDGSHRLSSLAAWINDDYGDGTISRALYGDSLTKGQEKTAAEVRKLVRRRVGSYEDLKRAAAKPGKLKPEMVDRAKNLGALAIQVQWVEGDAGKAENSFFKINQQAAPIDKTELVLLKSRKKPNCIAARAIIRGGKGHKYWSDFSRDVGEQVESLGGEINRILFVPPLEKPIRTLDLPVAGKNFSGQALPLMLEIVNAVNAVPDDFSENLEDDVTGQVTVQYLEKVLSVARRINSMHSSSLGLHPRIYSYSSEGFFKPASVLATVSFVIELEGSDRLREFAKIRGAFEECLLEYGYLFPQIVRYFRSATKAAGPVKDFMMAVMEGLLSGKGAQLTISDIRQQNQFAFLVIDRSKDEVIGSDFSPGAKSAVFLRDTTTSMAKCSICGGYIHTNSMQIDHVQRKSQGGVGDVDNGALSHPYCNQVVKH